MTDMRPPRSGGMTSDGRFKTTRSYVAANGTVIRKEFPAKKGQSKRDVIQEADAWQAESRGKVPGPNMTVRRAMEIWLIHRDAKLGDRTKDDYRFSIEKMGALADKPIGTITVFQVEQVLNEWEGKRTGKKIRDTGRNLFNWLRKMKWVTENPFSDAEPVGYEAPMFEEGLTAAQVVSIIEKANPPAIQALLTFLAETGRRPGMARQLLWKDLESREDGLWCMSGSKTKAGKRPVPIPKRAADAILTLPRISMFVFAVPSGRSEGGPYSEEGLRDAWDRACAAAEVEITGGVYNLRHFYASQLRRRGIVGSDRARLMGHSKAETSRFYDQFSDAELREMVEG